MGTKNNPGASDCYAKADGDEPLFTLLARDPIAPSLVRIWRALRARNLNEAVIEMGRANKHLHDVQKETSRKKLDEALQCAIDMERWQREHRHGKV